MLDFLILLKAHQPKYFSNLYDNRYRKKIARRKKIDFSYDSIKKNVYEEKIREDIYNDIGFSSWICNGKDGFESMTINTTIGGDMKEEPNSCTIDFPQEGEMYDYYRQPQHLSTLLKLMIKYWQPDYVKFYDFFKTIYPPFKEEKWLSKIETSPSSLNTPPHE